MNETLAEILMQGVNLAYNALIIVLISSLFGVTALLTHAISQQEASGEKMRMYAEYNQFDGTHCYQQDIISVVYEYRGRPEISVTKSDGSTLKWTAVSKATEYKTEAISKAIPMNVIYDADITYSKNGDVSAITFKACTNASCPRKDR